MNTILSHPLQNDSLALQAYLEEQVKDTLTPRPALAFSCGVALAILWDDLVNSSPFITRPLLNRGSFGNWELSFAINALDPSLGLNKDTPQSDIVYLKRFLSSSRKGFEETIYSLRDGEERQSLEKIFSKEFSDKIEQLGKLVYFIVQKDLAGDCLTSYRGMASRPLSWDKPLSQVSLFERDVPGLWAITMKRIINDQLNSDQEKATISSPKRAM